MVGTIRYSAICRIFGVQQNIRLLPIVKIWVLVGLYHFDLSKVKSTWTLTCFFVFNAPMPSHGPVHVVLVPGGSTGCQLPVLFDVKVLLVGGVVEFPVVQVLHTQEPRQFVHLPVLQMVRMTKNDKTGYITTLVF